LNNIDNFPPDDSSGGSQITIRSMAADGGLQGGILVAALIADLSYNRGSAIMWASGTDEFQGWHAGVDEEDQPIPGGGYCVAFSGSEWMVGGTFGIYRSYDARKWKLVLPSDTWIYSIQFNGVYWIAVGVSQLQLGGPGMFISYNNGDSWDYVSGSGSGGGGPVFYSIAFNGSNWIAGGYNLGKFQKFDGFTRGLSFITSANGTDWYGTEGNQFITQVTAIATRRVLPHSGSTPNDPILFGNGAPTLDDGFDRTYYLDTSSGLLWGPKHVTTHQGYGGSLFLNTLILQDISGSPWNSPSLLLTDTPAFSISESDTFSLQWWLYNDGPAGSLPGLQTHANVFGIYDASNRKIECEKQKRSSALVYYDNGCIFIAKQYATWIRTILILTENEA
jgi:hypothetical protein